MPVIEIWPYIEKALADEKLHDLAFDYLLEAIPGLKRDAKERRGTVRGSDAGNCVLAVHADLQGLSDPFPPEVMLTRLDLGSLYGAHIASLFKAGYEQEHPEHGVFVEQEATYLDAPCHADIAIVENVHKQEIGDSGNVSLQYVKPLFTVEVKTNYKASNPDEPRLAYPHQMLQAAHQAMAFGVDQFAIFTLAPAAQWKKGVKPEFHRQDNYRTFEFAAAVTQEYGERLAQATDEIPPQCDGKGFWVTYCRNIGCPHRKQEVAI